MINNRLIGTLALVAVAFLGSTPIGGPVTGLIGDIARAAGTPADELSKCADAPETKAAIEKGAAAGTALSISGTPTIYVNGKKRTSNWSDNRSSGTLPTTGLSTTKYQARVTYLMPGSVATEFGRGALLARRLVEHGVRFVTVGTFDWDHHGSLWTQMKRNAPKFARALSALVADIFDRGLSDRVLVVVMGGAVVILFFLPWLDNCAVKSIRYRPDWHKYLYGIFVINFVVLAYLCTQPPSPIGERISQVGTLFYFGFFLLMPWWSTIGDTKPVPDRVTFAPH